MINTWFVNTIIKIIPIIVKVSSLSTSELYNVIAQFYAKNMFKLNTKSFNWYIVILNIKHVTEHDVLTL